MIKKHVRTATLSARPGATLRLAGSGSNDAGGMGGMNHGADDGMATDAEMRTFDQAEGVAAERMHLEMMTKHHQGAITMAQAEIKDGKNADAVALAGNIVTSKQQEITTMKKLLANL